MKNDENAKNEMQRSAVNPGLPLKDLLLLGLPQTDVYLVHETADVGFVPASGLMELTDTGKEKHTALLNAVVNSIRPGAYGVELVLGKVDPQALADFDEAMANHRNAEYTMGDFTL